MLDLDGDVVGDLRVRGVQRVDDAHRVRRTVEEIGIAERDVLRRRPRPARDVGEHDVGLHDAELSLVDRHDRAMAAQMLAAAAGFGVPDDRRVPSGMCSVAYRASGGSPLRSGTRKWSRGTGAVVRSDRRRSRAAMASGHVPAAVSDALVQTASDRARSPSAPPRTRRRAHRRRRASAATAR